MDTQNLPFAQIAHMKWAEEILEQVKIKISSGDKIWLIKYTLGHIRFTLENRDLFREMISRYWKGLFSMLPEQIEHVKKYENTQ